MVALSKRATYIWVVAGGEEGIVLQLSISCGKYNIIVKMIKKKTLKDGLAKYQPDWSSKARSRSNVDPINSIFHHRRNYIAPANLFHLFDNYFCIKHTHKRINFQRFL